MRNYLLFFLFAIPLFSQAQDTYTLKFLPQINQSQWANASNQTDAKITIGLPLISNFSFQFYNSGFTYHDLFQRVDNNTVAIHPSDFINHLKDNNIIGIGATVAIFSINIAQPDYSVGFSINDKIDARFNYPKDLLKFFWYGNGAYLGQTVNIGNMALNASWYREYALHATKNYEKWTFGISPKLLFGKVNINTKQSSLQLYTAPDFYDITANPKMNVQTSGFSDSADRATGGNQSFSQYFFDSKNRGLGIDLSAKYQLNKQVSISGGINNLGYIKWQNHVHNFTAGPSAFSFDGFDISSYFQGDTNILSTSKLVDSVKNLIKFQKNSSSYTTPLPYELYAMGNYQLNDRHTLGLLLDAQRFNQSMVLAGTVCYQINLNKYFTGALSYTAKTDAYFNLGIGLIAHVGPIQIYFVADNWWASIEPLDSKNVNLSTGINLAIGQRKTAKTENRAD